MVYMKPNSKSTSLQYMLLSLSQQFISELTMVFDSKAWTIYYTVPAKIYVWHFEHILNIYWNQSFIWWMFIVALYCPLSSFWLLNIVTAFSSLQLKYFRCRILNSLARGKGEAWIKLYPTMTGVRQFSLNLMWSQCHLSQSHHCWME